MNYTVEIYAEEGKTKENLKEARKHYTSKPRYDCYQHLYTGYRVIATKTDNDGNVERIY